jgi:hypothetical protein
MSFARPIAPLRIAENAELLPIAQYALWHTIAAATPGLTQFDRQVAAQIADHHRCRSLGGASRISVERLALDLGSATRRVRTAISHLGRPRLDCCGGR